MWRWAGVAGAAVCFGTLATACIAGDKPAAPNLDCEDGVCACDAGFGNCDDNPANGCESILANDPRNCGACGSPCSNGSCDAGVCTCNAGFSNCNDDPTDGCESLLRLDPDHCGECDRGCLGGPCSDSRCAPFLLAELGGSVYALEADDAAVYVCGVTGVVYRVDKIDREPVVIAADQNCFEMALSRDNLFWSVLAFNEELVRRAPLDGGPPETIGVAPGIGGFAATEDVVVWSEFDAVENLYSIVKSNALGSQTAVVQTPNTIGEMAAANDRVFWVEEDVIGTLVRTLPLAGGSPTTLATVALGSVPQIVSIADNLYWLQLDEEGENPSVHRVRSTGGVPEELLARKREMSNFVGNVTGLFWTEDQGDRLMRASLDGAEVSELADFTDVTLLAAGGEEIYWIDFPSHLFALAK